MEASGVRRNLPEVSWVRHLEFCRDLELASQMLAGSIDEDVREGRPETPGRAGQKLRRHPQLCGKHGGKLVPNPLRPQQGTLPPLGIKCSLFLEHIVESLG